MVKTMNIVRFVNVLGWLSYESLFMNDLNVSATNTKNVNTTLIAIVFHG